jgi:SET domain-containing protein
VVNHLVLSLNLPNCSQILDQEKKIRFQYQTTMKSILYIVATAVVCSSLPTGSLALVPTNKSSSSYATRPLHSQKSFADRSAVSAGIAVLHASEKKGFGAFATSRIPFGTMVGEYIGEVMTLRQVKARYWGKRELDESDKRWVKCRKERDQGITGNYVLELEDGSFVDGEDDDVSGWCRFMNHAKEGTEDCNVKGFSRTSEDENVRQYPCMYAIKDIEVGDELSWDYKGTGHLNFD